MKTLKAIIFAFFLFLGVQIISLKVSYISQTASKQIVNDKRVWARNNFIHRESGKKLVFFFGNSHTAAGIIPDVFDRTNNGTTVTYNLSLVGLQTPPHYFLLKDYLKHNPPPDYILMNVLEGGYEIESFPSYALQGAGLLEVLYYGYYRKNWDIVLNYIFPSRLRWPEVARYFTGKVIKFLPKRIRQKHKDLYLDGFRDRQVWGHNRLYFYESQFIKPEELTRNRLNILRQNRGYYYIVEESAIGGKVTEEYLNGLRIYLIDGCAQDSLPPGKTETDSTEPQIILDPFVEKLFELAQKHNIKIILMPDYSMSHYKNSCGKQYYLSHNIPLSWKFLSNKYNNVFILADAISVSFHYKYFSDPSHLNPEGAKEYTHYIAKDFLTLKKKEGF